MLRSKTRWLSAAALLAVPLVIIAWGSGGSGNPSPNATATLVEMASATPTATKSAASLRLDVKLSNRDKVALPAKFNLRLRFGSTYHQRGSDTQNFVFIDPVSTYSFRVSVTKSGAPIKQGDILPLSFRDFGSNAVFIGKPGDTAFISSSGTYKVNSLTKRAATRKSGATTSGTFTLSNVQMVGPSLDNPLSEDGHFILNGIGAFTVKDTDPL